MSEGRTCGLCGKPAEGHQYKDCALALADKVYRLQIDLTAARKPAPQRIAELEADVAMWKRQRDADNKRWEQRLQRQVDYTNVWHGRYEVLRHENYKIRKKLQRSKEESA